MTINRWHDLWHCSGQNGYATVLGRLAVPVLVAQAVAPTLARPWWPCCQPALWVLMIGAGLGLVAMLLLLPLRLPRTD